MNRDIGQRTSSVIEQDVHGIGRYNLSCHKKNSKDDEGYKDVAISIFLAKPKDTAKPSSLKNSLKYGSDRGIAVPVPKSTIEQTTSAAESKRVHFDEKAVKCEKERAKAKRSRDSRWEQRKQRDFLKFKRNETYLFLILTDVDILIQQYQHTPQVRDLFEAIFSFYHILGNETDSRSNLISRFVVLRANARMEPKYLLSFDRHFQKWSQQSRNALGLLQSFSPIFAAANKDHTSRWVFFHLKHTIDMTDLRLNYRSEEQILFRKCLEWFFREAKESINKYRHGLRRPYLFGSHLQSGLVMLQDEDLSFENLRDKAKSLLFVMGGMPAFLAFFEKRLQKRCGAR